MEVEKQTKSLVKREFITLKDSGDKHIRVLQWNILCNGLAFGSFDRVPNNYLDWSYREDLIIS
jgi:mRNA deadenylase 3'-5' endonuclease subunit Ccr4